MDAAELRRDLAMKEVLRRLFHSFDSHRAAWHAAVSCASILDCLFSLARWSYYGDGGKMSRPVIVDELSIKPFLHLKAARHPCISPSLLGGGSAFVPNDVQLGEDPAEAKSAAADNPSIVLLTGPNMGGKSTWMRMAAVCSIFAQLGCYVPAASCRMTPVDRVFTRVGASDRLLAGQSTFFVELAETSTILACATPSSLVILDELGRGTSTFDGCAIAFAVVKHLAIDVPGARVMFATHYHTLTADFADSAEVALGHMKCHVEKAADGATNVTFLYTFAPGACPKSHGLNVARIANLPASVITRADEKSLEFEQVLQEAERRGAILLGTEKGSQPTVVSKYIDFYRKSLAVLVQPDIAKSINSFEANSPFVQIVKEARSLNDR
jgi:DNA mismatch repair protein MSH6